MEIFSFNPMTYPTAAAIPQVISTFTVDTTSAASGPGWGGITTVYYGAFQLTTSGSANAPTETAK